MLPGIWSLPGSLQRSSGLLPEWGGRFQDSYSPLYELPTRFPAFNPFRQFRLVSLYEGSLYSEFFWSSRLSRDHCFLTGIPSLQAVKFLHSAQSVLFSAFLLPGNYCCLSSIIFFLVLFFILRSCPFYQVNGFQEGAKVNMSSILPCFLRIPSRPLLFIYLGMHFFFLSVRNKKHPPGQVFIRSVCLFQFQS